MPTYYIPIIAMLIVLIIVLRRRKSVVAKRAVEKRKTEGNQSMLELAKRFIGKECIIYSFDGGHQFTGVVKEVSDSAVLVERNGEIEAINLDFAIRIREYPRNKKGKKKSIVID